MSDDESEGGFDEGLNHFDPLEESDPEEVEDDKSESDSDNSEETSESGDEDGHTLPGGDPRMAIPGAAGISKGVRDIIIVRGDDRVTSETPTRGEITGALAIRAAMIARHPTAFVPIGDMTSAEEIAKRELKLGRSPIIIHRQIGVTPRGERIIEEWPIREMAITIHL